MSSGSCSSVVCRVSSAGHLPGALDQQHQQPPQLAVVQMSLPPAGALRTGFEPRRAIPFFTLRLTPTAITFVCSRIQATNTFRPSNWRAQEHRQREKRSTNIFKSITSIDFRPPPPSFLSSFYLPHPHLLLLLSTRQRSFRTHLQTFRGASLEACSCSPLVINVFCTTLYFDSFFPPYRAHRGVDPCPHPPPLLHPHGGSWPQ